MTTESTTIKAAGPPIPVVASGGDDRLSRAPVTFAGDACVAAGAAATPAPEAAGGERETSGFRLSRRPLAVGAVRDRLRAHTKRL